ncbi:Rid family detoxifying hydrolase [Candidatus Tachikawaea gelatinosa]|uniref:Putative translation initiation inhibitor-yjgF family n=1 Tax=Candidatus Tachikawaea gelatinosa TaxID=1410383 RepID=A0A090BWD8_9ENTR|nr:Rid family detoxifying hydrolase [Candidatus Tachikawaea gelatinosa]BAP58431.1 putative translation initiation inhibitor- yjgF family [Candidatus Tachikawaea gelatinosa]
MSNFIISTDNAPKAIGPYVQGLDLGQFVIISGQIPVDPKTNTIPNKIEDQVCLSLNNIKAILEKAKLKVNNIVKIKIFMINLNDFEIMNKKYQQFFLKHKATYPVRSCVEVSRLPKDVKIEIEATAVRFLSQFKEY